MTLETLAQSLQQLFQSDIIILVLEGIIVYLAIFWIAVIIWVTKDSINRSTNVAFQIFSILLVIILTPLFGIFIYLIVRPSKTLTETYLEDMQLQILNEEENRIRMEQCEKCNGAIYPDYMYCPHCAWKIKKSCLVCKKQYPATLHLCPYCGKTVKGKKKEESEETTNQK